MNLVAGFPGSSAKGSAPRFLGWPPLRAWPGNHFLARLPDVVVRLATAGWPASTGGTSSVASNMISLLRLSCVKYDFAVALASNGTSVIRILARDLSENVSSLPAETLPERLQEQLDIGTRRTDSKSGGTILERMINSRFNRTRARREECRGHQLRPVMLNRPGSLGKVEDVLKLHGVERLAGSVHATPQPERDVEAGSYRWNHRTL